jgi:hypothetical protein
MPIMELTGDEDEDVAKTFSYMYFPDNSQARNEFIFLLRTMNDVYSNTSDILAVNRDVLERILNSSSPQELSKEMSSNFHKGGFQSGSILHNLLCFEATDQQKASLNAAIELTKRQSKAIQSMYPEGKIKSLTSASYWGYWKKYKQSAHLWGAYVSLSITAIKNGPTNIIPLQAFLLESERYRLLGEKHIDSKTGKPALPLGLCWTPPEGYLPPHNPRPFMPGKKPDL